MYEINGFVDIVNEKAVIKQTQHMIHINTRIAFSQPIGNRLTIQGILVNTNVNRCASFLM